MKSKAFKIWDGDVWIIGGGGSIRNLFDIPDHLYPLHREEFLEFGECMRVIHDKHVLGVNLAGFLGDWVDVMYFGDAGFYREYKVWIQKYVSGLIYSSAGKFVEKQYKNILHLYKDVSRGITKNRQHTSWTGKNSGASAINIAYHLGAKRIFLLGFDMKLNPEERMHWHAGYPDKTKTPSTKRRNQGVTTIPRKKQSDGIFKKHKKGFPLVQKDAEEMGLRIINVNPDSDIMCFEKMTLEEALNA